MTIQIRQMLIRSTVATPPAALEQPKPEASAAVMERLRAEVLAECKAMIDERLQQARER